MEEGGRVRLKYYYNRHHCNQVLRGVASLVPRPSQLSIVVHRKTREGLGDNITFPVDVSLHGHLQYSQDC